MCPGDALQRVGLTADDEAGVGQRHVGIAALHERIDSAAANDRVAAEATGEEVGANAARERVVSPRSVERHGAAKD